MKQNLSKITGFFKIEKLKNNKQLVVFLVCLLIATVLWFLNALSKDYSTTISYPVKYVSAPKNQFLSNKPPSKLELKVDAHGFTLLRHKLSLSFSPIVLNLTNLTQNMESNSGTYSIRTNSLVRRISDQVSSEITITDILPEYFNVVLDSLKTKIIPVELDIEIEFRPQFNLKEPISTTPENVKITGPATILDTIYSLKTVQKSFTKLDSDIEKEIDLFLPDKTTISPKNVTINIAVEKFTEKEMKIPIEIINKPVNAKIKLFPSEIKVLFTVGLSEFDNIKSSDFRALVDYNLIESGVENMKVTMGKKPNYIQMVRFNPETVEFLIEIE
ncbi:MAG: YbbR-like domain-containing protein [Bacteroidetes bacterium]|nr:YbbR-like domain-containing protein [Bacteroidota bacterium]